MNTENIFPTKKLEDIFLIKANMYPKNLPLYNYLISSNAATRLELEGMMETAYFLRCGVDDRY